MTKKRGYGLCVGKRTYNVRKWCDVFIRVRERISGVEFSLFFFKQKTAYEIKLLEWLIGADPESDEFKAKEKRLSAQGEAERKRVQAQVDAKAAKDAKKGGKKGKKKAASDDEDDE